MPHANWPTALALLGVACATSAWRVLLDSRRVPGRVRGPYFTLVTTLYLPWLVVVAAKTAALSIAVASASHDCAPPEEGFYRGLVVGLLLLAAPAMYCRTELDGWSTEKSLHARLLKANRYSAAEGYRYLQEVRRKADARCVAAAVNGVVCFMVVAVDPEIARDAVLRDFSRGLVAQFWGVSCLGGLVHWLWRRFGHERSGVRLPSDDDFVATYSPANPAAEKGGLVSFEEAVERLNR